MSRRMPRAPATALGSGWLLSPLTHLGRNGPATTSTTGAMGDEDELTRRILELKSTPAILPVHAKQLLTYLRLSGIRRGLLLNFGAPVMHEGIRRLVVGR